MANILEGRTLTAIGVMSGTSMDGIDVALVTTDGDQVFEAGPTRAVPFAAEVRGLLLEAVAAARDLADRNARPEPIAAAEATFTDAVASAVGGFLADNAIDPAAVDVVGFHGQTVLHAPERALTVQTGDAARLARAVGIDVVHDFRAADVAAGGEGAPLVPVFHRILAGRAGLTPPVAIANLGGVANVTFLGRDDQLLAFDTGPASALLDDLMRRKADKPFDRNGATARRGRPCEEVLERLMADPYFRRKPPKSLDRNAFDASAVDGLPLEAAAATLTAFSARAFARGVEMLPAAPKTIVVTGGGAHNPTLLDMIEAETGVPVTPGEKLGLAGDFVEAQAFGYLAVRHLEGLPLTYPGTTGVPRPTMGGVLVRAAR